MKYLISLLCIHLCALAWSQDLLYVGAQSGLIVRDAASLKATRIAKLNYGDQVALIERTNEKITIVDHENKLSGRWYQVKSTGTSEVVTGYVFSGYLTYQNPDGRNRIQRKGYDLLISPSTQSDFDTTKAVASKTLKQEQSVQEGYLSIKSPMELQLKLKDGSLFTLKKEQFEEQFQGYDYVYYDLDRGIYVIWENWLEAGHPIMVDASDGTITNLVGSWFSFHHQLPLAVNYAEDIGAGWTPNGIQVFEVHKGVFQELFKFDPAEVSGHLWGPVGVKWKNESTLLIKCVMSNAEGGYFINYKKLRFQKFK